MSEIICEQSVVEKLTRRLDLHKSKNLMRTRSVMLNGVVDFSSNDYLDLASNPEILSVINDLGSFKNPNKYGSGGSSYVTGYTREHKLCEDAFAKAFGFEKAFLFGNGFMANMGVIKALADKQTLIFSDKLNHASLIDGALASDGKLIRYSHLNLKSLENSIQKHNSKAGIIASDVVFSMDGDIADIRKLLEISNKYNYPLILDEAHSAGVLGDKLNLGLVAELDKFQKENIILICPLGKAFGAYGAVVLANGVYKDAIEQFARTLIYSTALPGVCAKIARKSLDIIKSAAGTKLRENLKSNICYFYEQAKVVLGSNSNFQKFLNINNQTAIQTIIIGDPNQAMALSEALKSLGFYICAMRSPTVPVGTDRVRIVIRAGHTFAQIDAILRAIKNYLGDLT